MKTANPENGFSDTPSPKRSKVDNGAVPADKSEVAERIDAMEKIQEDLHKIDEKCAKEQMEIQKRYDEEKRPYFDKRQNIIETIPGFWAEAFAHHALLNNHTSLDKPLLQCLKRVELEDNLDDNGSYKITFVFSDEIEEYFEPKKLVKSVVFDEAQEETVNTTEIKWKEGKNYLPKLRTGGEWSIFQWFSKCFPEENPDLGEIIRREIWHAPLQYYLNDPDYDDEEDDDEDDENDEENEDDEEDEIDEAEDDPAYFQEQDYDDDGEN